MGQDEVEQHTKSIKYLFFSFWPSFSDNMNNFPTPFTRDRVMSFVGLCTPLSVEDRKNMIKLAKVLRSEYIDDYGTLDEFRDHINNTKLTSKFFSKTGTGISYYAPLIAICQRSGSGKTRLMLEMGRNCFPMVYISLGSDLISPTIISKFLGELADDVKYRDENERKVFVFITTLLNYTLEQFEKWKLLMKQEQQEEQGQQEQHEQQEQQGQHEQQGQQEKPEHLNQQFPDFFNSFVTSFQPVGDEKSESDLEKLWKTIIDQVNANIADKNFQGRAIIQKYKSSNLPKLLIAIDEARVLLATTDIKKISAFRLIRGALSLSAKAENRVDDSVITVIVADTNSSITNFAPVAKRDPSERFLLADAQLIPPFFMVTGFDVKAKIYLQRCQDLASSKGNWWNFLIDRDTGPCEFLKLGCPLWGAFMEYGNLPESSITDLIAFAKRKLLGGCNFLDLDMNENVVIRTLSYIAALASRMSLTIIPKSNLTNLLVASCMAQLEYLSADRQSVYINYPSDVVLAEAAADFLDSKSLEIMRALLEYTANSEISLGDGGESIAEMIVLAAIDNLKPLFNSVLVEAFLKSLFGEVAAAPILDSFAGKPILKGRVCFNHFIKLKESATVDNLIYCFIRGAAISGYTQQFGWDLCIPVCLEDGRLSAIFIQIKNYKDMMKHYDVIGIMQRMRLAGSMLLNPPAYKSLWNPEVEKKPTSTLLGKRMLDVGNENLDDISMNILINLLQGHPLPSDMPEYQDLPDQFKDIDVPHLATVQPGHNFIAIQGFSIAAFPNIWGNSTGRKKEIESIMKHILKPRSDYIRLMEYEQNERFQKYFKKINSDETLSACAKLHNLDINRKQNSRKNAKKS